MSGIIDVVSAVLILSGAIFILISSIGLIKMPDIYMRMSATTKATTLGVGSILLGTALYFEEVGIITRAIIIIIFLFLTAPIGAHLIGRAAYFDGIPLWDKSIINELEGSFNPIEHVLYSEKFGSDEKVTLPREQTENNSD
ncbi:MAG: monovalent cation/H(+) antiporter subunit G [Desulfobulbaceae bacterium]|nr:monovalent cation/H(+) antiporter subunit G [Desulfobulbaceae bacterium]